MERRDTQRSWAPVWLAMATAIASGAFLLKPVHIDDPLFVWAARNITRHPLDPYGFDVNWYGMMQPMSQVTQNPPLAPYFMAAAARLLGWSEPALHAAFLLPAILAVVGTYFLAGRLCGRPVWASLLVLASPVFLLSSTTLMCDVMMLAFWTLAIVLWMSGIERRSTGLLALSAIAISLCALTKYFGLTLIPLLLVHSVLKRRRLDPWLLVLLIPVASLAAYQSATKALYGAGLLTVAMSYASMARPAQQLIPYKTLVTFAFMGGSTIAILPLAPALWCRRTVLSGAIVTAFGFALACAWPAAAQGFLFRREVPWTTVAQWCLFVAGGAGVIGITALDVWRRRDAESALLGLWVLGTAVFCAFFNWTINGRSILPMVPAAAILLVRRLDDRPQPEDRRSRYARIALAVSGGIALAVTWADHRLAWSSRQAAAILQDRQGPAGDRLFFQGHWGFQYYMESYGRRALERGERLEPGDRVVIPVGNTNLFTPEGAPMEPIETVRVRSSLGVAAMNSRLRAGFYSDIWGPMPYVFGPVPPEEFIVARIPGVADEPPAE